MKSIGKAFWTAATAVSMLIGGLTGAVLASIGGGIALATVLIGVLSLPLSMLAIMRIEGWVWWLALSSALILSMVPILGQVAVIVLSILGAYYLVEARFNWREAIEPTPQVSTPVLQPARVSHCINADVSFYGNLRNREDKQLEWLRQNKEEYRKRLAEQDLEGNLSRAFDAVNLADPKFLEGYRLTFGVAHSAGCLEYEKQLATQGASAPDDALFESCISASLATQVLGELPDFQSKQRERRDPSFDLGTGIGIQRGHVDGCTLAEALKRSGY